MKRFMMFLAMGILVIVNVTAWGDVPNVIQFQGRLNDPSGDPVPDGSYSITFTIYDAEMGGTALWSEAVNATVDNGNMSVALGSLTPFPTDLFDAALRWLGIKVGTDPEMTPRIQFAAVPYSHRVGTVDGASGGEISSDVRVIGKVEAAQVFAPSLSLEDPASPLDRIVLANDNGTLKMLKEFCVPLMISDLGSSFSKETGSRGAPACQFRLDFDGDMVTTGKLGIGTTSPQANLHVSSPGATELRVDGNSVTFDMVQDGGAHLGYELDAEMAEMQMERPVEGASADKALRFKVKDGAQPETEVCNYDYGGNANFKKDVVVDNKLIAQIMDILMQLSVGPGGVKFSDGTTQTTAAGPGNFVSLQGTSPGTQQTGNVNVSGTIVAGGGTFSGPVDGTELSIVSIVGDNGDRIDFQPPADPITGTLQSMEIVQAPPSIPPKSFRVTDHTRTMTHLKIDNNSGIVTWTQPAEGDIIGNAATATTATNFSGSLAGDVSGTQGNTSVQKIRGTNVSPTAPTANQALTFDGVDWRPAQTQLATGVAGTLPVANGGTGAPDATGARANLGAASMGANNYVGTQTIQTGGAGNTGLAVVGSFGQLSPWMECRRSDGTRLLVLDGAGSFRIYNDLDQNTASVDPNGQGNFRYLAVTNGFLNTGLAGPPLNLTGGAPGGAGANLNLASASAVASLTGSLGVNGDLCATGTIGACSDARFKRNVKPLVSALDKVQELQGVRYEWKREEYPDFRFEEGNQIGLIAQEVEKIFPEVVSERPDGYLMVDYGKLSAVLVEAVKEQQKTIENLNGKLEKLEDLVADLLNKKIAKQ